MDETMKLLIVDDDKDLLRQLEFLLEDDFEEVYTASSRDEALNLASDRVDVFLVDVRLSDTDDSNIEGLELVKEIRKEHSDAVIVMMSRYDSKKYETLAINEAGADAFIRKPFTMDVFIDMMTRIKREKKC